MKITSRKAPFCVSLLQNMIAFIFYPSCQKLIAKKLFRCQMSLCISFNIQILHTSNSRGKTSLTLTVLLSRNPVYHNGKNSNSISFTLISVHSNRHCRKACTTTTTTTSVLFSAGIGLICFLVANTVLYLELSMRIMLITH